MPRVIRPENPITVSVALDAFLLDRRAAGRRPATLKFYAQRVQHFIDSTDVEFLADVTPHHIRTFLVSLQDAGWKPSSQDAAYRALRAFFNYCETDGWRTDNPMRNIRQPKPDAPRPDVYEPGELVRLLAAANTLRDKAIIAVLADTGARPSESLAVECADINPATGAVMLRRTKTRDTRTVYVGDAAGRHLMRWYVTHPTRTGPLWLTLDGDPTPLTYHGLRQLLRRLAEMTGIERVNAYKFRRTYATTMLRNGIDTQTLMALMGHKSPEMLKHYVALRDEDLRRATRKFSVLDNLR